MKTIKKLLFVLLAVVMASVAMFGCGETTTPDGGDASGEYTGEISIYMPDGAPALAFAKLMNDNDTLGKESVTYTVVKSEAIGGYVSGKTATAALMPLNLASKLCGEDYKVVSVLTHGNIYVIGKGDATALADLKDKKVGVVQLANVPGLTFRHLLAQAGVDYVENEQASGKVSLYNIADPATIAAAIKNGTYDYVVAPQPAAANVCKNVEGASVRIDLNALYSASGFPQAVLVAKNELCADTEFMTALETALEANAEWIKEEADGTAKNAAAIVDAINAHFAEGATGTLKAPALSLEAIKGSNVYVQSVKESGVKTLVKDYINNLLRIAPASAQAVTDAFFLD